MVSNTCNASLKLLHLGCHHRHAPGLPTLVHVSDDHSQEPCVRDLVLSAPCAVDSCHCVYAAIQNSGHATIQDAVFTNGSAMYGGVVALQVGVGRRQGCCFSELEALATTRPPVHSSGLGLLCFKLSQDVMMHPCGDKLTECVHACISHQALLPAST